MICPPSVDVMRRFWKLTSDQRHSVWLTIFAFRLFRVLDYWRTRLFSLGLILLFAPFVTAPFCWAASGVWDHERRYRANRPRPGAGTVEAPRDESHHPASG